MDGFSEALSLELKPEWNIKVTIVMPGRFSTNFEKSIILTELAPDYEGSPASVIREVSQIASRNTYAEGDPAKAALAIIKIAHHDNPPLRLPLGPDALNLMKAKLQAVAADIEAWQELAASTSFENSHSWTLKDFGLSN